MWGARRARRILGRELAGLGCAGPVQERGFEAGEAGVGVGGGEGGGEGFTRLAVGDLAGGEVGDEGAEEVLVGGRQHAGGEGLGGEVGAGADGRGEGGGVEGGGEGGAVLADLEEERVGVVGWELAGEAGEALRVGGGELVEDFVAQRAGLAVLEDAEAWGDARFQREAADEGFAEGVDGLDAQAAGGFQGAGEEGAGLGEVGGVGLAEAW